MQRKHHQQFLGVVRLGEARGFNTVKGHYRHKYLHAATFKRSRRPRRCVRFSSGPLFNNRALEKKQQRPHTKRNLRDYVKATQPTRFSRQNQNRNHAHDNEANPTKALKSQTRNENRQKLDINAKACPKPLGTTRYKQHPSCVRFAPVNVLRPVGSLLLNKTVFVISRHRRSSFATYFVSTQPFVNGTGVQLSQGDRPDARPLSRSISFRHKSKSIRCSLVPRPLPACVRTR